MNATRTVSESGGLPAHHIDAFLDRLRTAHYSEVSLRKKRRVLRVLRVDEEQEH